MTWAEDIVAVTPAGFSRSVTELVDCYMQEENYSPAAKQWREINTCSSHVSEYVDCILP